MTFSIIIKPAAFEERGEGTYNTLEEAVDFLTAIMRVYNEGDVLTVVNDTTGAVVFRKEIGK